VARETRRLFQGKAGNLGGMGGVAGARPEAGGQIVTKKAIYTQPGTVSPKCGASRVKRPLRGRKKNRLGDPGRAEPPTRAGLWLRKIFFFFSFPWGSKTPRVLRPWRSASQEKKRKRGKAFSEYTANAGKGGHGPGALLGPLGFGGVSLGRQMKVSAFLAGGARGPSGKAPGPADGWGGDPQGGTFAVRGDAAFLRQNG